MKRLFRIFELSKNEQRVVLIVVLMLITIAFVNMNAAFIILPFSRHQSTEPKPSPTLWKR